MARPSKPVAVLRAEGRSHRTKKELAMRERGEEELLTGKKLREFPETKADAVAHAEFMRVSKLLREIGKNDDLYANSINRYCALHSEVVRFQRQCAALEDQIVDLADRKDEFHVAGEYFTLVTKLQKQVLDIDKRVQEKRGMMLQIEKENLLTIASALRSVPKQPGDSENALIDILADANE